MKTFPIQTDPKYGRPHPPSVPWEVAEKAYSVYSGRHGKAQTLDQLAARGGFSPGEMDIFLPSWRADSDALTLAKTENQKLRETLERAIGAIPVENRTTKRFVDVDEAAGSTYELDLKPWLRDALVLLGKDPELYY